MDFSEKLKQIRNNEGISQEQLAERIGVSRQAVTKWETGKGLPDIENMTILAEIFKVTLDRAYKRNCAEKREIGDAHKRNGIRYRYRHTF